MKVYLTKEEATAATEAALEAIITEGEYLTKTGGALASGSPGGGAATDGWTQIGFWTLPTTSVIGGGSVSSQTLTQVGNSGASADGSLGRYRQIDQTTSGQYLTFASPTQLTKWEHGTAAWEMVVGFDNTTVDWWTMGMSSTSTTAAFASQGFQCGFDPTGSGAGNIWVQHQTAGGTITSTDTGVLPSALAVDGDGFRHLGFRMEVHATSGGNSTFKCRAFDGLTAAWVGDWVETTGTPAATGVFIYSRAKMSGTKTTHRCHVGRWRSFAKEQT